MKKHHSFRPSALSPLEDRVVLSHGGIAQAALVQPVPTGGVPVSLHALALNGTISGTFVTTVGPVNGVAETITSFKGSGTITGLGQVNVSGSLVQVVSPTGQVSTFETFTLSTAKGSISIQLTTSPSKTGTPGLAQSSFTIIKATGAFQGDVGTGTASLQTITQAVPVIPPTTAKGIFTLTLKSSTVGV
jgi:hypothetical protein